LMNCERGGPDHARVRLGSASQLLGNPGVLLLETLEPLRTACMSHLVAHPRCPGTPTGVSKPLWLHTVCKHGPSPYVQPNGALQMWWVCCFGGRRLTNRHHQDSTYGDGPRFVCLDRGMSFSVCLRPRIRSSGGRASISCSPRADTPSGLTSRGSPDSNQIF
jgi:hypothetical protein